MSYPIDDKLVIAVSSSALFDLSHSHQVFLQQGMEEYRRHQEAHLDQAFPRGVAFSFIRRFLHINQVFAQQPPVEVEIGRASCRERVWGSGVAVRALGEEQKE